MPLFAGINVYDWWETPSKFEGWLDAMEQACNHGLTGIYIKN